MAAVAIFLKVEYDGEEEKDDEDSACELGYAESILSEANENLKKRKVVESKYQVN